MSDKEKTVAHFLQLIQKSRKGKFKIYIGMSAGVGKTYRMLQEARVLLQAGVQVRIGFIETHQRVETAALVEGLPLIPRRQVFYRGKALEEMDLEVIIQSRPDVVLVDELAHSNVEGSKHPKRWQDVLEILDAGINVISAVNIQHIESLADEVKRITGVDVRERIPDRILSLADEVVNIDLPADELVARLRAGKIYPPDKVEQALTHFFRAEHVLQLRELALKAVAAQVERKVEDELAPSGNRRLERFLACISSNDRVARQVIRKTARLASYYNSKWYVLYVRVPSEHPNRIPLDKQRHLINNFKLATELGAEVIQCEAVDIAKTIADQCELRKITTVCLGRPRVRWFRLIFFPSVFRNLLAKMEANQIDLIMLS